MRFYKHCANWKLTEPAPDATQPLRWHREHWVLAATAALLTLLSAVVMPSWAHAMQRPYSKPAPIILPLSIPALPPQHVTVPREPSWEVVTVQSGQTLSAIFEAQGLGFNELKQALAASKDASALHNLHPGDTVAFRIDTQGNLEALRFDASPESRVTLHFDHGHVTRSVQQRAFELRVHAVHGTIEHSLAAAAVKAGLSDAVMVKLAHVFRNEINFRRDIRAGDTFTVVYNGVYRDGEYLHAGNVLAAEFRNRGHIYTAYRFTLPDGHVGYYTRKGRPLSVSLLRTPVKYTRVSSSFGWRVDPVLHSRHLHTGVDLAAAKGTPIHAASRGEITVHRWVHGYGRFICIKLNSTYSTCYAHMSKYAPHLAVGSDVHQGEVIGYVGMTGYATGPHLHFEVRVHGKPVNPLTVTMPKPKPLAPKLLAEFHQDTKPLFVRINQLDQRVALAKASASDDSDIHNE